VVNPWPDSFKKKAPGKWIPGAEDISIIKQAQAEGNLPDRSADSQEKPFFTLSMFINSLISTTTDVSLTPAQYLVKRKFQHNSVWRLSMLDGQ